MPLKRKIKNTAKKDSSLLRTWIFDLPAKFALLSFGLMFVVSLVYTGIASLLNTPNANPLYFLLLVSIVWSTYYLVKSLPHDNMHRNGFIAITNTCCLLTLGITTIISLFTGNDVHAIKANIVMLHITNPTMFLLMFLCAALLSLYVFGLAVSNFYAKYKRAREIGISKWKIICSFPFAFLLIWAPGYLIDDKQKSSNVTIQSHWYSKLNNWIVANKENTMVAFLILVLLGGIFADSSSLLLDVFLLIVYALWSIKHKKDFLKNINRGYALSAISINMITIFMLIVTALINAN